MNHGEAYWSYVAKIVNFTQKVRYHCFHSNSLLNWLWMKPKFSMGNATPKLDRICHIKLFFILLDISKHAIFLFAKTKERRIWVEANASLHNYWFLKGGTRSKDALLWSQSCTHNWNLLDIVLFLRKKVHVVYYSFYDLNKILCH
jgi:hypothetical protein